MQDELYESTIAFLQDRQLDHATDATHRFEYNKDTRNKAFFAGLEDRKTREQDEFKDLAKHVGRYQEERVKVLEFLSPTFTLHFEITIYNGERSNLQSLVKSMTQAMIGSGSGMDGIWKMPEMKTYASKVGLTPSYNGFFANLLTSGYLPAGFRLVSD